MDDRGQTYYYLRDGSKSQWHLPEVRRGSIIQEYIEESVPNSYQTVFWTLQAPVALDQSRTENGVEADNTSVLKNWRHTMTPAQFGSAQDEGVHANFLTHLDL